MQRITSLATAYMSSTFQRGVREGEDAIVGTQWAEVARGGAEIGILLYVYSLGLEHVLGQHVFRVGVSVSAPRLCLCPDLMHPPPRSRWRASGGIARSAAVPERDRVLLHVGAPGGRITARRMLPHTHRASANARRPLSVWLLRAVFRQYPASMALNAGRRADALARALYVAFETRNAIHSESTPPPSLPPWALLSQIGDFPVVTRHNNGASLTSPPVAYEVVGLVVPPPSPPPPTFPAQYRHLPAFTKGGREAAAPPPPSTFSSPNGHLHTLQRSLPLSPAVHDVPGCPCRHPRSSRTPTSTFHNASRSRCRGRNLRASIPDARCKLKICRAPLPASSPHYLGAATHSRRRPSSPPPARWGQHTRRSSSPSSLSTRSVPPTPTTRRYDARAHDPPPALSTTAVGLAAAPLMPRPSIRQLPLTESLPALCSSTPSPATAPPTDLA
ncbi:hypothetical protein GGX14DRAFT_580622 [Mycena pura]|uniref:Uncharacterized protein n=1 Tax=Mycena pura TaxID=153505 RepID=A0AAD6XVN6_9AGAR|nr:hypothetical protein GGX14DRAFT_580622 [Mycena pura]